MSILVSQFLSIPFSIGIHISVLSTFVKKDNIIKGMKSESHSVVSDSLQPHGLYSPWNSPGLNTGVGSQFPSPGDLPTQRSNPSLPDCRQILYQFSHQESPGILECVAYSFSGSSWHRKSNQSFLHCRQILYHWATGEALDLRNRLS